MISKSVLAGLLILFMTLFEPNALQRERPPNDMITVHGGTGSFLLPFCDAALKSKAGGTRAIKPAATEIQEVVDGSYCRGYVLGVVDTLISVSTTTKTNVCIPDNADNDQLVRIVDKYLNDNPAKLNDPAVGLIMTSMLSAFPCK
jgi:hypothetical protein